MFDIETWRETWRDAKGKPLAQEQKNLLRRLPAKRIPVETTGTGKKTIRIGELGYINSTVIRYEGLLGLVCEGIQRIPREFADAPDRYGRTKILPRFRLCSDYPNGWIVCRGDRPPNDKNQYVIVTDIKLAEKILGL